MSMWTDMMAAETAMRAATALIEEQRAAIALLVECIVAAEDLMVRCDAEHFPSDELKPATDDEWDQMILYLRRMVAKHAPAQSQEQPK